MGGVSTIGEKLSLNPKRLCDSFYRFNLANKMGAGASAESARMTVSTMLMNKPEDASDVVDLAAAKSEIVQLRKMAKLYQEHLKST